MKLVQNEKAVGPDNVKNEMLQVDTSLRTRLIIAIWERVGELAPYQMSGCDQR